MQKNYEIIRLIEQGTTCHIVMDYVEGERLVDYLKRNSNIEKEQIVGWIKQIVRQLDNIQRTKRVNEYKGVTPYCLILKQDRSIAFLDLKAESNAELQKMVEKEVIQHTFFCGEEGRDAYYSVGKTMQYLFAHTNVEPKLTRREESQFLKIISKCLSKHSKKYYSNISDILKDFPQKRKKKGLWLCFLGAFIAIGGVLSFVSANYPREEVVETVVEEKIDASILFDVGLTYFVELENYEKSFEFFNKSRSECELGNYYAELAKYMCGKGGKSESEIEVVINQIEGLLSQEEEEDLRYVKSFLKVYMRLDTEEARVKSISLGEKVLAENNLQEKEVKELLAAAYIQNEEYEKAIEIYEVLCKVGNNEAFCKRLLELYEKTGQEEKALEKCGKYLSDLPYSKEISIMYIRMECKSKSVQKEVLETSIREILNRMPELVEESEFQKLQTEYGIKIEGEKIWVER